MLNGKAQHSSAADSDAQAPHHSAGEATDPFDLNRSLAGPSTAVAAQLSRHLIGFRQQLRAAQEQIRMLLVQDALLKQKVVLLAQAATQARDFAYHDQLTGLPNRSLLLDRFQQAVARAQRQYAQVALLFLNLDHFKNINDTFGYATGDKLLQQIGARLSQCIRASDTACRYGGDEFVVLLPEFTASEGAVRVAQSIRTRLALPYLIDGISIQTSISLGVAVYPVDGKEYGDLIHQSDVAMHRDKHPGAAPSNAVASARARTSPARLAAVSPTLAPAGHRDEEI